MALNNKVVGGMMSLGVLAAFAIGYGVRAQTEPEWMSERPLFSPIPTVRTADGGLKLVASEAKTEKVPRRRPNLKMYETIAEVRQAIRSNFVKTEIDENELTEGAVRGMLRSLGDKFTRYLTPEEFEQFQEDVDAQFVGVGMRIDIKDDYVGSPAAAPINASRPYVFETIAGGPAAKAGLQKNDVILAINGRSTAEMSAESVVNQVRGAKGTSVKLKIERLIKAARLPRDRTYKVFDVTLVRNLVEVNPVALEWLPDRIAWMRLSEFNYKSDAEIGKALQRVQDGPDGKGAARGLVFDLRGNPGGLLDVAVKIGSSFVKNGPIVYTRERDGHEEHLDALGGKRFLNLKMPVVVLIDNGSASAAEVLTGALKDNNLATVVGEQSYGKASVQVLLKLKNGGALIMTTAKYLTPSKHDITEKGIAPDVVVKASTEDEKSGRGAQLDKAVALIRDKSSVKVAAASAR